MRLPLFIATVLVVSVISSVCTSMVFLHLSAPTPGGPPEPTAPSAQSAPTAPPLAVMAPVERTAPASTSPGAAAGPPVPAEDPGAIPPPPPPLVEIIPPPPEAPAYVDSGRARTIAPAPAPATPAATPAAGDDPTPIAVQHEVNDVIYRDYFGCTQAEVVVITTCQRCYQFPSADVLAVCLVARWAGIPLSVAFRTFYDDDHGSIQALIAGYHLDPAIFFAILPGDLLCPGNYHRPYQLFRTLRGSEASYSNDEYRALIALKIACDFQGRQPAQFFACVQHGDTPLQAVYRGANAAPALATRSWSGSALHAQQPGVRTAASELPPSTAAAPAGVTMRASGELRGAPSHLDQPARASQPVRNDVQERTPAPVADAGHAGLRPAVPPIERQAQGQSGHEAAGTPQPEPAARLRAEPLASAPASGQTAVPGGQLGGASASQAAAAGAAVTPHH